jgi:hypothetical protein
MWSCAFKGWFFQNGCRCHGNGQNAKKLKNTKMIIAGYSSIQHYVTKFVRGFLGVLCISSTNKTDGHDIAEILLKVALNTIILYPLANIIISAKSHFLLPWYMWKIVQLELNINLTLTNIVPTLLLWWYYS